MIERKPETSTEITAIMPGGDVARHIVPAGATIGFPQGTEIINEIIIPEGQEETWQTS